MTTVSIILAVVAAVLLVLVIVLLTRQRRTESEETARRLETSLSELKSELLSKQMESLSALHSTLDSATRTVNERLSDGTETLDRRLSLFNEIEGKLGKLAEQTRILESIGKDIRSLSDLLRPPKVRGTLGEMFLENLLSQILPPSLFDLQYSFSDGRKVDAIVRVGRNLLPIDSKFPLESFQRAVASEDDESSRKDFRRTLKKHVDMIAERYIVPDEQTTDFALMYIPSEAVYYHFVADSEPDSLDYALSRRIIPSSPGHLYAFLASLSAVSAGLPVSADSRRLIRGVKAMEETVTRLRKWHERMESSLRHLANNMSRAREEERQLVDNLERLKQPEDAEPTPATDD